MTTTRKRELIRESDFVLEVEVEVRLGEADDPWSPAYPLADAQRLYDAREAMEKHDWLAAQSYGHLYRLEPVSLAANTALR